MDKEEGEMSDDFMEIDDETVPASDAAVKTCEIIYKAVKHGPIVKKLERVDAAKLEERAERFGLNLTGSRVVTQKQIDELYSNCGVDSATERHFRFDALHLSGIGGLSTKEIFEYLEDFKPVSLEWVDDDSCNIVCQDHISAALALLVHSRDIVQEEIKTILAKKSQHYWREGMPHAKKDLILMRFATNAEKTNIKKKPPPKYQDYDKALESVSKNPWGDLCQSWGVYDHQEVLQRPLPRDEYIETDKYRPAIKIKNKKLANRLGKRPKYTEIADDGESTSDSEWKRKSKAPRMRMHADDIEEKQKKSETFKAINDAQKDIYAPLAIEIDNSQSDYTPRHTTKLSDKFKYHNKTNINVQTTRIHSRLGSKINTVNDTDSEGSQQFEQNNSDEEPASNIMSRVQKVSSAKQSKGSIWSRLQTKSKDNDTSDLRQRLKSRKDTSKKPNDLRSRLGKSQQSNLRIEIDNNLYN